MKQWEYFYYGPDDPPPRRPWLRDAFVASIAGAFLGGSIGYRIATGEWPYALAIGVPAFVVHVLAVGFGQLFERTRLTPADLKIVGSISVAANLVAALATWVLTA